MSNEIDNIDELMQALCLLPESEFEKAVGTAAAIMLGTIRQRHGRRFLKDFCQASINDTGEIPCLNWCGPKH